MDKFETETKGQTVEIGKKNKEKKLLLFFLTKIKMRNFNFKQ
jgi:hypothetical protein